MASVLSFVRGADFSKNDFHQSSQVNRVTQICNVKWMRVNKSAIKALPDELERLHRLEVLYLARNKLKELHTGNIPSISSLRVLYARHNELRDSGIPSDLFKLEHLATLDFSHNDLSKIPEELFHAKGVLVLALAHNKISTIPGALFVHCSDIQSLDLSDNALQSLPPQIRRLSHLQTLNLANNPLHHYQFKMLEKLTSLTTLNLSNTGVLSMYIPNMEKLQSLSDVNLSHNELTRIPDSLYLLENLQRVDVSHNSIKELSTLIESWSLLVTLNVSSNQLTSIPSQICKCTKLRRLFLSDNNLTFEGIPPQIGKLQNLQHFIAARNQLKCIPEGICRCYQLKKLILTTNKLLTLPEGLYFLNLEVLDTRDNPELGMPPKPTEQLTGSGTELYNIDFDPVKLKEGAVVSQSTLLPSSYSRRKERVVRMARLRGNSLSRRDENSANKVLKGLARVADDKNQQQIEGISEEQAEVVLGKPKPWYAKLNRPNLDYSSLFPDKPGRLPGLTLWQIENFVPVMVDEVLHGRFYTGDCYIVLKTFFDESSSLDWRIHYWIGQEASLDKMACSAMHAVHLRNMLGADSRTVREEQNNESEEFIELFNHDISYIEGGTASGFYSTEEEETTPRLYLLGHSKQVHLEPMMLHAGSLDQGQVFILTTSKTIYVWCGTKSPLTQRSKGRLVAEKINKNDCKNLANVLQFKYANEPEEFWDFFGGPPEQPIWHDKNGKSSPSHLNQLPKLYQVTLGKGYLELPQVEVPGGVLKSDLLNSKHVYIMDCYSELFVWVGKMSERLVRAAALRLAQELCELLQRPAVATVTRVLQGGESFVFKSKFTGWEGVLKEDYSVVKGEKKTTEKRAPKVDLSPLFLPRQPPMSNRQADNLMDEFNANLKSDMQCFVLEGKKFVKLPKREIGHFYSEDCYVFLCQYVTTADDKFEEEEMEDEEDDDDSEIHTVVYFWQGRDAGNMGWLTFTFSFQNQIKKLIAGPVFVKRIRQQQEEYRLLSHFGGKLIMHKGKRGGAIDSSKPELYQIRSNSNKICRRVVQVAATPTSLCSAFCYVLKVPFEGSGSGIVYIWIGSQATQEEAINAEQMGRSMFEMTFSNQTVKEGAEPENFFWVALGKREEYDKEATFLQYSRLFRCSNSKGFFSVEEECQDFCQDSLSEDDVMLLDTGKEVFIWVGQSASDIEKKLSLKSAQVYIKHVSDDPNQLQRKIRIAKRGAEPHEFKRCFHGWSP